MSDDVSPERHDTLPLREDSLAQALLSAAAREPASESSALFGQFVGAWDLEWHGLDLTGSSIVVPGELHFGWILGGWAVQDVWRVPVEAKDAARMRGLYGTTIRFYDAQVGAWRSTWIDPLNGRVRRFISREVDGAIVLEGLDENPRERWSFRDITPSSFLWRGEESTDGGLSWTIVEEMYARRRTP